MDIIKKIEAEQMKSDLTDFNVGDSVKVHTRVVEGGKERIQLFSGLVIAKHGAGINAACTVRKISYGEGVERVFPSTAPSSPRSRSPAAEKSAVPSSTTSATAWGKKLSS